MLFRSNDTATTEIYTVTNTLSLHDALPIAAQNAIREASRTLRNIRSLYVKDMSAAVENGRVTSYRLNSKVTLELEGTRSGAKK